MVQVSSITMATLPSWVEHADLVMKFVAGLVSIVGVLLTSLSIILWGMIQGNRRKIETLNGKFEKLPDIYIERHFCMSCQKGQDVGAEGVSKLLGIMQERQYRIEETVNDLRGMMVEFLQRKHE